MLTYFAILLTIVSGVMHAPWWFAITGGTMLGALSIYEQRHLKCGLAANDNLAILNPASLYAASVHCILGATAYPIGYLIRAVAP